MLFNVISYKFGQSNHMSNEIKKDIVTVYPYDFWGNLCYITEVKFYNFEKYFPQFFWCFYCVNLVFASI